ncbi:hypothetical protein FOZ63_007785 [Perkinsus olseni]|uniref:Uncharacterized protein n=1 Tax=Perkinsus olseni TaxID=32597 RepID=A0A7J6SJL0_PEROL|nr:hypothetical protein FOZ62_026688 [Perkinsus olseni]KAF4758091.1 hypothetical protein FOZ63_007785 [Perkinsus olseni]
MTRKRTIEDVIDLTGGTPERGLSGRSAFQAEAVKHVRIDKAAVAESTFHKLMQAAQALPSSTAGKGRTVQTAAARPPEPKCKYCGCLRVSVADECVLTFTQCSACGDSVCNMCSNYLSELGSNVGTVCAECGSTIQPAQASTTTSSSSSSSGGTCY